MASPRRDGDMAHATPVVVGLIAALCMTAWSIAAGAQAPPAPPAGPHSLSYRNVVVLQGNPILLRDMASLDYRYRLYESESRLLRDNYLGFALRPVLSPGFSRIGGAVELAPASVVRLGVSWEQVNYFGTFNQLQSFENASSDYSDARLGARADDDQNYAASGTDISLSLLLQNRLGPVILRDLFELHRVSYALRPGDGFLYDPVNDLLVARRGFTFTNDFDILYISTLGVIAGLRYTVTDALYPETAGGGQRNGPTHRLGPSMSYVVFQNPGAAFDSATIFVLLNWWLKHRYRAGAEVSAAVPFLSVGFSFTGKIL